MNNHRQKAFDLLTSKGRIRHPLTNSLSPMSIASVLEDLAAQEGCDGEPYDQMVAAAAYIKELEDLVWALSGQLDKL